MQQPLVSVLIPVKNGLPHFRRVLDMLQKQDLDAPFEVIVVTPTI
nr:glycosyltransferase [Mesorhizobium sp.]